ncbi:MAG: hypothetical protein IJI14_03790 [Anaerolineaceae bacterium]|nr:hypothetical protein [Anaerolineaceae bacterium]
MRKITKEEFAAKINKRRYGEELTKAEEQEAKENGLIVVFGASDDLMEFRGAIDDEAGCYDGGEVTFDSKGTSDDGEYHKNTIEAIWCGEDPENLDKEGRVITWTYRTEIPHVTFMIYDELDDLEPYCRGIVFSVEDIEL